MKPSDQKLSDTMKEIDPQAPIVNTSREELKKSKDSLVALKEQLKAQITKQTQ